MIKLVKLKAMKILYQINQCQRLKSMSTPIAKSSSDDEEHNNEESEMIIEAML